jgi:imidazolonepropionase-like amidohydrolase
MKTVLSRANLIDCVEPRVRPDIAVLVEDGRIRAILPSGEMGSVEDAQTIDLKGAYLMPGLWDVHIHPDYLSLDEMPLADQVAPAPTTSWTSLGNGPSILDSTSALGCLPAVISSPPLADTS